MAMSSTGISTSSTERGRKRTHKAPAMLLAKATGRSPRPSRHSIRPLRAEGVGGGGCRDRALHLVGGDRLRGIEAREQEGRHGQKPAASGDGIHEARQKEIAAKAAIMSKPMSSTLLGS